MDNTCNDDQKTDLDLWPYDLKINWDPLLSRGDQCTKFVYSLYHAKILIRYWWTTLFNKDHKVDLDLWPCKLKIDRDYLLSRGNHRIKFDARGQQILRGQHLIYRSIKWGYNKESECIECNTSQNSLPD